MRIWDCRSDPPTPYRLTTEAVETIHFLCSIHPLLFPHLQTIVSFLSGFHWFLISHSVSRLDIRFDQEPGLLSKNLSYSGLIHLRSITFFYDKRKKLLGGDIQFSIAPHLPEIEEIGLPFRTLDAPLAKALSQHKNLRKVMSDIPQLSARHFIPYSAMQSLLSIQFCLQPAAFPALTTFHVPARTISEAYTYITGPFFPFRNLTSLRILSPVMTHHPLTREWKATFSSKDIEELISNLAISCCSLGTLDLRLHEEKDTRLDDIMAELEPLEINDIIRGTLRFTTLFTFRIYHPYPIRVKDSDIVRLTREWPHLHGLHLSPCPLIKSITDLSLGALVPLTTNCPEIEDIGIYINGGSSVYRDGPKRPAIRSLDCYQSRRNSG